MATMISQAGSAVVEHVAKKNALVLTDDACLRAWTKQFAELVATYRSMVRICTKNDKSYVEPSAIKDAVTGADQFLLQHTHWTWDEDWVSERWRRAAQLRKKLWEAEVERIRILKEKEEKLRQQIEEEKILSEARALLNAKTFNYLTEEEWDSLLNDPPIEEGPPPSALNLFDPAFDPVDSEDRSSPLSDLTTSSPSSPETCVDPPSPPPTGPTLLPNQKCDDGKLPKDQTSPTATSPESPPIALKPNRGGPAGRNGPLGQRGRGGSAAPTIPHIAPAARGSTTVTGAKNGPVVGPAKAIEPKAPERLGTPSAALIGRKPTGTSSTPIPVTATTAATTASVARKAPTDPKPIHSTAARDPPVFIPKNRPGPQTSQLRLPKTSTASPSATLPKLDTTIQLASFSSNLIHGTVGKRKVRDEDEDFIDDESDEENEKSLYLMSSGGILIGTGQINSPSCFPCARANSKCFRLNGRSCCARCHQEHVKCPLDKDKPATHTGTYDKPVALLDTPPLPTKGPNPKKVKTNHGSVGS
ncbi:hypothetical protein BT96DRAFT_914791 [Gymnopus androsaceus JB14]|uniref:Uncharacterized protein n=1 Tax=Gymnopus androsaceus JB14 TaxID=1447944 RepID=A0A6A4IBM4_9AGAR|nr:hypothetical protein BT96DRAFT_914791 [Gymnopus androsaceus JB14]